MLASLDAAPVPLAYQGRGRTVTSYLVRETVRQALYAPVTQYEPLALLLASCVAGDFSPLFQSPAAASLSAEGACEAAVPVDGYSWNMDAAMGVLCGDSIGQVGDRNATWARSVVGSLEAQSPTFGSAWARLMLSCTGWEVEPGYAFAGPFGGPAAEGQPLLVLSNRLDHATPLGNAVRVAGSYPGSGLVIQEASGHTALLSSKSECVARAVGEYMDTGKVVKGQTICQPECLPSIPFKACPGLPA